MKNLVNLSQIEYANNVLKNKRMVYIATIKNGWQSNEECFNLSDFGKVCGRFIERAKQELPNGKLHITDTPVMWNDINCLYHTWVWIDPNENFHLSMGLKAWS